MPGIVRLLIFVGLAIAVVVTARLGLVVAATPSSLWLQAQPPLADVNAPPDARASAVARAVAPFVDDPALLRGELDDCRAPDPVAENDKQSRAERNARCLTAVDRALAADPASSELWLFKADRLLRVAELNEAIEALRKSYVTGAREGWIASGRVVLGLQLLPLLSTDLKTAVGNDLRLVIQYPEFGEPLLAAYASNAALRQTAQPAMEELPRELLDSFVARVRARS
jgi:hypothetical protein